MEEKALLGIVLFPLFGAIVNGLLGRGGGKREGGAPSDWEASRSTVHAVACLSVAASFGLAVYCFAKLMGLHSETENVTLTYTAYQWFSLDWGNGKVPVDVRFAMDALSGVMTLIVTGIGLLIHVYSTGYMSEEKSYARFFSYLNLFTASMLILVLGSNLPVMFVGWEGVGLCSYLLIGFWWENPAYASAGRKAFVANRIGDFGVLIGMFLLVSAVGSFEFSAINAKVEALEAPVMLPGLALPVSIATAATLFLFLGCTGKSAQIPLYVWLPDAMAGPTPVSALIHAATMVTSGLYLVCRLSPVFAVAPDTMMVVAVIGALTALLAATIGCVQNEIKKVLAYSTVSQLGFMFAAAGCGAFAASFFHVYTHAFFKACLFLGAGSVMHAVGAHGDADIRRLGGLRKYLPKTHATFLASCLAIAGFPLFSGFFSKDEILVGALSVGSYFPAGVGEAVFATLVLAATMTAFYMFRLYFLTFAGEYRGGPEQHGEHAHGEGKKHDPHESPDSMTVPLVLLAAGSVFAGYLWVGLAHFEPWVSWLKPSLGDIGVEHHGAMMAAAAGLGAALAGIGLAYSWYGRPGVETPARLAGALPRLHRLVYDKWRVDELYDATILAASRGLGVLSAGVDKLVVDGALATLTSATVRGVGFVSTRLQNGLVQSYAAVLVLGLLGVTYFFAIPHIAVELPKPPEGNEAELVAQPGFGYEYRWDFDSDGKFDTEYSAEPTVGHSFADAELEPGAVVVIEPAVYAAGLRHKELPPGARLTLDPADLGPGWQRNPDEHSPPQIEVLREGVVLHPNAARVRVDSKLVPAREKVPLARGQHADVGQARVTVARTAKVTAQVINAFGVERKSRLRFALPHVRERVEAEVVSVAEASP